jgi:hypothetical protein
MSTINIDSKPRDANVKPYKNSIRATFFDDRMTKARAWFREREQRHVRKTVDQKYLGKVDRNVFWHVATQEADFGLPVDPVERRKYRLVLAQVGYDMGNRMWARRRQVIVPVLTVTTAVGAWLELNVAPAMSTPIFGALVHGGLVAVGACMAYGPSILPSIASFLLPNIAFRQDEIDKAKDTIERCFVRPVDSRTPADLADRLRVMDVDSKGRSVAGQILASDFNSSMVRVEWWNSLKVTWKFSLAAIAPAAFVAGPVAATALVVVAYWKQIKEFFASPKDDSPLRYIELALPCILPLALLLKPVSSFVDGHTSISAGSGWAYTILILLAAIKAGLETPSPLKTRALQLEQAERGNATPLLINEAGRTHFVQNELARLDQFAKAIADESLFFELGKSTGHMAERRDPFAPTEAGMPFGLTMQELLLHVVILGKSGAGKTKGAITKLVTPWIMKDQGGALVGDGKSNLPKEFEGLEGYTIISPKKGKQNVIHGMNPDAVSDTLAAILGGSANAEKSDGGSYFTNASRLMLRMALIIMRAAGLPYTIPELYRFCMLPVDLSTEKVEDPATGEVEEVHTNERLDILKSIPDRDNTLVRMAMTYWAVELPAMDERTRANVVSTCQSWLGNIVMHEELSPWVDTVDSGWTVESVLTGEKAGILLSESEYGPGGVALSGLLLRRVYDALKRRGDGWKSQPGQKPVMICTDEIQVLLTKNDIEMLGVGRSLGLSMVSATQNLNGLYGRLGEQYSVDYMLGNFNAMIALDPADQATNEFIEWRMGSVWRSTVQSCQGIPDAQADVNLYENSGTDHQMLESDMMRQRDELHSRLAYSVDEPDPLDKDGNKIPPSKPILNIGCVPLVQAREISTLLSRAGSALVSLRRGDAPRRDMIRLWDTAADEEMDVVFTETAA